MCRRETVLLQQRGMRDGVWAISGASGVGVAHHRLRRGSRGSRERWTSALMERGYIERPIGLEARDKDLDLHSCI